MNGREWQSPLRVRGVERPGLFEPLSHAASGGQAMDDNEERFSLGGAADDLSTRASIRDPRR